MVLIFPLFLFSACFYRSCPAFLPPPLSRRSRPPRTSALASSTRSTWGSFVTSNTPALTTAAQPSPLEQPHPDQPNPAVSKTHDLINSVQFSPSSSAQHKFPSPACPLLVHHCSVQPSSAHHFASALNSDDQFSHVQPNTQAQLSPQPSFLVPLYRSLLFLSQLET